MWVYLRNAFLSIVENRDNADLLLVRARIRGDIERVFPDRAVIETGDADYRYRAFVPRMAVASALYEEAAVIDYPNFKARVGEHDSAREALYSDVWAVTMQGAAAIDQYIQPTKRGK